MNRWQLLIIVYAAQAFAFLVSMIAATALLGFLLKLQRLRDWGFIEEMDIPTAVALMSAGISLQLTCYVLSQRCLHMNSNNTSETK